MNRNFRVTAATAVAPRQLALTLQWDGEPLADVRAALVAQVNALRESFRKTSPEYAAYVAARAEQDAAQKEHMAMRAQRKADEEESDMPFSSNDHPARVLERKQARQSQALEGKVQNLRSQVLTTWRDFAQRWMIEQRQAALEQLNQALAALDLAHLSERIIKAAELDAPTRQLDPLSRRAIFGEP